jgi:mannose-6-phosphate isomerase-like protein (cupin superfamily)
VSSQRPVVAAHPVDSPVQPATDPCLVLRPGQIGAFDRGSGVKTLPFVGKWNTPANETNRVTTGMTVFAPGTAIPLHSHNVEESVLVFAGEATAVIGEERFDLVAGQATWVPAGIPHCRRDDHLLGLRRPGRHPHRHRHRRDLRAPVRK